MPLFTFLDESGSYQYTKEQSNFIVYTAVVTSTPSLLCQEFSELKYELHLQGQRQDRFHACEDLQVVRNRVFGIISKSVGYAIHAIVVRKNKINPVLHKYGVYSVAYRTLLRYLVAFKNLDRVCIIVDTVPDQSQQVTLKNTLRARTEEVMNAKGIPYTLDHHTSHSHTLLQVADYCAWAIYRKWANNDARSYTHIQGRIQNEYDIFANGDTTYY
jgi:hypothetical protein